MIVTTPQSITVIDIKYMLIKCFKDTIETFGEASATRTLSNTDALHTTIRYILLSYW